MLIESIKLENFRQFQNESITFADGSMVRMLQSSLAKTAAVKPPLHRLSFGVCTVKRLSPTSGCSILKLPAR